MKRPEFDYIKIIEELGELSHEVCKLLINNENIENLIEEVAHVEVQIEFLKNYINHKDLYKKIFIEKSKRRDSIISKLKEEGRKDLIKYYL